MAMSSLMRVYMPAIKAAAITRGDVWQLDGDPIIHRIAVALKKRYGMPGKVQKLALSLSIIWALAVRIPGYPVIASMSHDDRLWLLASVMGCLGMLRGGEFLKSAKQSRAILMAKDLSLKAISRTRVALVVEISKPKARWWVMHAPVTIVSAPGTPLDIAHLFRQYKTLSPHWRGGNHPALVTFNGKVLPKNWMFASTDRRLHW